MFLNLGVLAFHFRRGRCLRPRQKGGLSVGPSPVQFPSRLLILPSFKSKFRGLVSLPIHPGAPATPALALPSSLERLHTSRPPPILFPVLGVPGRFTHPADLCSDHST